MSRIKPLGLRILAASLMFGLATGIANAKPIKEVINAGTITYYPPFSYKDPKTSERAGFDHDLFEAMAKKVGSKVNWVEFSFEQITSFAPLKTGRVDVYAMGGLTDTPERRKNGVTFLDFVYDPFVLYAHKDNVDQYKKDLTALCGRRVSATRSSPLQAGLLKEWSKENCESASKPPITIVDVDNSAQSLLMIKQNRVDASANGAGPLSFINKSEGGIFVSFGKPLTKFMYGMAYLDENKEFGESLRTALDELIADGTYSSLLQKWGLPAESSIGEAKINAGTTLPQ
ncbi:MAG: transporter substrate-binding domain-containing protein [Mesorhizobium sp.]|uniref:transporter substrate-binding domain-containing protein n=1 Tax=Mesorhizobium sp. TaxID=1871066 RepID=UPI0011F5604A|nr:transporter substrate-binding domain-containing protein [Mesorhizobium sp.]TIR52782.1 MAG: transporter substrate-binding domain-containing protein [Mesorhizobium sp.]